MNEPKIAILRHWFDSDVSSFSFDTGPEHHGPNSDNFIVRIDEAEPTAYVLKRVSPTPRHFEKRIGHYQRLKQSGAPFAAIVPTVSGEMVLEYSDASFCLMEYITGAAFAGSLEERRMLSRALAQLSREHDASSRKLAPDYTYNVLSADERKRVLSMVRDSSSDMDRMVANSLSRWVELYKDVEHFLEEKNLPKFVVQHRDIHTRNVLFRTNSLEPVVLDPASVGSDWLFMDVAFAADRFSSSSEEYTEFIKLFCEQCELDVRDTLELFVALGQLEALRRIMFLIRDYYMHGRDRWLFMLARLEETVRELPEKAGKR